MVDEKRVTIDVCLHGESSAAWLVSTSGNNEEATWVGKEIATMIGGKGRNRTLELPYWLAYKEGFI